MGAEGSDLSDLLVVLGQSGVRVHLVSDTGMAYGPAVLAWRHGFRGNGDAAESSGWQ